MPVYSRVSVASLSALGSAAAYLYWKSDNSIHALTPESSVDSSSVSENFGSLASQKAGESTPPVNISSASSAPTQPLPVRRFFSVSALTIEHNYGQ